MLQAEFARVAAQQDLNALDLDRYRIPKPSEAQRNNPEAWQAAVDNAKAQLHHQHNRCVIGSHVFEVWFTVRIPTGCSTWS